MSDIETERQIRYWLLDMDGVLIHEEDPIPGADANTRALLGTSGIQAA